MLDAWERRQPRDIRVYDGRRMPRLVCATGRIRDQDLTPRRKGEMHLLGNIEPYIRTTQRGVDGPESTQNGGNFCGERVRKKAVGISRIVIPHHDLPHHPAGKVSNGIQPLTAQWSSVCYHHFGHPRLFLTHLVYINSSQSPALSVGVGRDCHPP